MSKLDAGLELLSSLNTIDIKAVEIRDLLYYLITKDFSKIDEILAAGQKAGLLTNLGQIYLVTPGISSLQFEKPKIIKQQERANCRFCGKKLSTGYYVVFTARTYGPFGSGCIQKMHMSI
jgi:hypothetical protein